MSREWAHDELARDLAGHLAAPRRMLWQDMQLGPAGSPRPDVYAIDKSFVSPFPTAYECKISVADFRSDVTSGKWSSYLKYAYRVFFAVPAGMIDKREVPDMCGLILRHETAWRIAKRPTVNPVTIPQSALLKLLIDGVHREGPPVRARAWNEGRSVDRFSKKFGSAAARYVVDAVAIHTQIEHARLQCLDMHEKARKQSTEIIERAKIESPVRWAELLDVLGLEAGANRWAVEREIKALRDAKDGTVDARELRRILNVLRRLVDSAQVPDTFPPVIRPDIPHSSPVAELPELD